MKLQRNKNTQCSQTCLSLVLLVVLLVLVLLVLVLVVLVLVWTCVLHEGVCPAKRTAAPNYGSRVPVDTTPGPAPVCRALKI